MSGRSPKAGSRAGGGTADTAVRGQRLHRNYEHAVRTGGCVVLEPTAVDPGHLPPSAAVAVPPTEPAQPPTVPTNAYRDAYKASRPDQFGPGRTFLGQCGCVHWADDHCPHCGYCKLCDCARFDGQ